MLLYIQVAQRREEEEKMAEVVFYTARVIAGIAVLVGGVHMFFGRGRHRWGKPRTILLVAGSISCAISTIVNGIWHVNPWPTWRGTFDVAVCLAFALASWWLWKTSGDGGQSSHEEPFRDGWSN